MKKVNRKIFELWSLMSELSERCYCAGWMRGTEFVLWEAIQNGCKGLDWGHGFIKEQELIKLKKLSEEVGGWWIFTNDEDDYFGPAFIPLENWERYFKRKMAERNEKKLKEE
jgi:hypothetical protein